MKLATPHHAGITLHPHVAFDVPNKPADFKLTSLNQPVNHSACAACTKAQAHPRSFPLPSPSCVSDISCPPFHLLPSSPRPSISFPLLPSPFIPLSLKPSSSPYTPGRPRAQSFITARPIQLSHPIYVASFPSRLELRHRSDGGYTEGI